MSKATPAHSKLIAAAARDVLQPMMPRSIAILVSTIVLVTLCSCSRGGSGSVTTDSSDIKLKLDEVLQEMIRMTDDPAEKTTLAQAQPFGNIKDLPVAVVGFALPQKDNDRRIHVSFTREYFSDHDVKTLAQEALHDWRSATERPSPKP